MQSSLLSLRTVDSSSLGKLTATFSDLQKVLLLPDEHRDIARISNDSAQRSIVEQRIKQLVGAWLLTADQRFYLDARKLFTAGDISNVTSEALALFAREVDTWNSEGVCLQWKQHAASYGAAGHKRDPLSKYLEELELCQVADKYRLWCQAMNTQGRRRIPRLELTDTRLPNRFLPPSPRKASGDCREGSPRLSPERRQLAAAVLRGSPRQFTSEYYERCCYSMLRLRRGELQLESKMLLDFLIYSKLLSKEKIVRSLVVGWLDQQEAQYTLQQSSLLQAENFISQEQLGRWLKRSQTKPRTALALLLSENIVQKEEILPFLVKNKCLQEGALLQAVSRAVETATPNGISTAPLFEHPEVAVQLGFWIARRPLRGAAIDDAHSDGQFIVQKREHYLSLAQQGKIYLPELIGEVVVDPRGRYRYDLNHRSQPLNSTDITKCKPGIDEIELLLQFPQHKKKLCFDKDSTLELTELVSDKKTWGDVSDLEQDNRHLLFEGAQIAGAITLTGSDSEMQAALQSPDRNIRLQALANVIAEASSDQLPSLAPPYYALEPDASSSVGR